MFIFALLTWVSIMAIPIIIFKATDSQFNLVTAFGILLAEIGVYFVLRKTLSVELGDFTLLVAEWIFFVILFIIAKLLSKPGKKGSVVTDERLAELRAEEAERMAQKKREDDARSIALELNEENVLMLLNKCVATEEMQNEWEKTKSITDSYDDMFIRIPHINSFCPEHGFPLDHNKNNNIPDIFWPDIHRDFHLDYFDNFLDHFNDDYVFLKKSVEYYKSTIHYMFGQLKRIVKSDSSNEFTWVNNLEKVNSDDNIKEYYDELFWTINDKMLYDFLFLAVASGIQLYFHELTPHLEKVTTVLLNTSETTPKGYLAKTEYVDYETYESEMALHSNEFILAHLGWEFARVAVLGEQEEKRYYPTDIWPGVFVRFDPNISVKPTVSPNHPNFESWWAEHKHEWIN